MDDLERDLAEIDKRLNKLQSKADQHESDIVKYLDRINDKLFSLNTLYVGAYLALVAIKPETPKYILVFPLFNALIIGYLDWIMMEINRRMAGLMDMTPQQIEEEATKINKFNLLAFIPVVTTILVSGILVGFVYYYM